MKSIISCCVLLCAAIATMAVTTTSPTTTPTTAPTQPSVVVRDTDAKSPTTQTVTNGGYIATTPKHWTLQFNFPTTPPTSMTFWIDGKQPHIESYVPWVCEGDDVPIDLPVGDHVITWEVNGKSPQNFDVSVLPPPQFGENLAGFSDARGDSTLHPQLLTAAKELNLSVVRLWLEGSFTAEQPISYFKISKQWQTAGVRVVAVANFQNASPRCSAPTDSVWTKYWTDFPTPNQTGIYAISIGNEINSAGYYAGTVEQMAHLMQLAYPILHEKGYTVIAGSDLDDLNYDGKLNKLNAFAFCDRIDVHAYYATAPQLAAFVDKGVAFGRSIHKPCDVTELGVRMNAKNLPAWAAAEGQALSMLKSRSGFFLPFSFYPMESVDQACPLKTTYENDENFYPAFCGALAK